MAEFRSFEELEKFIADYQVNNNCHLWKSDTQTLESIDKILPGKLVACNRLLKYFSITYVCSKGGRVYKSRRRRLSLQSSCPMHIRVVITPDLQKLKIESLNETHVHEKQISDVPMTTIDKKPKFSKCPSPTNSKEIVPKDMLVELYNNVITDDESMLFVNVDKQDYNVTYIQKPDVTDSQKKSEAFRHPGFHCNTCYKDIYGFRYTCIQCRNYDLCSECEGRGEHEDHYLLRIPQPLPFPRFQSMIKKIQEQTLLAMSMSESQDTLEVDRFRYACLECPRHDLCHGCEARGAHHRHYMLRIPLTRPTPEVNTILQTVLIAVTVPDDPCRRDVVSLTRRRPRMRFPPWTNVREIEVTKDQDVDSFGIEVTDSRNWDTDEILFDDSYTPGPENLRQIYNMTGPDSLRSTHIFRMPADSKNQTKFRIGVESGKLFIQPTSIYTATDDTSNDANTSVSNDTDKSNYMDAVKKVNQLPDICISRTKNQGGQTSPGSDSTESVAANEAGRFQRVFIKPLNIT